ncbi:hypothetical protein HNQ59_001125 [Chitinivorax tropicus]|uniref:YbhB/YbcL family Raf kinase inhibitor-like protein n=1 Tax=Chitinivorax tropicus TaxID=714531 RepID=A0A840MK30_9PROT|nr:YbhB/YbcL family Raf kinase inhibitor-like protein [Chitinivorax tropicus]MBB5017855.1 hypothetical protein [Chitinivorax tropicus]
MYLTSHAFREGEAIPVEYCFGQIDPTQHVTLAPNRNPDLAWHDLPADTRSLVLICHDPDVPSRGDDVNQEDRVVPADLPRVDFFHWVMVDINPNQQGIQAGQYSDGVTPRGKAGPASFAGTRHGVNDYTAWFAGDAAMHGNYYGYDGPCPPWNDSIRHRYIFTLYALDIERCPVEGRFTATQVREAIAPHTLAQASLTGWYTLTPALRQV